MNNINNQILCTHSGLFFAVFLGAALIVTGWLPPFSPDLDANMVATLFERDNLMIKIGASMLGFGAVFWLSFSSAIAMQMSRSEGEFPVLSLLQVLAAACLVAVVVMLAYSWLTAAFRVDAPTSDILKFSDFGWILFASAFGPVFMQNLAMGLCILTGSNEQRVYPRWVGFANLWIAVMSIPGVLVPFFKQGPFAWNGLFGFWIPAIAFFAWIIIMWWSTLKAIHAQKI